MIRNEIAALRGLGPRPGTIWEMKKQAVDCHFFFNLSTPEQCARSWSMSLGEVRDILSHDLQKYARFYNQQWEGGMLELIPKDVWLTWASRNPQQNKVYDVDKIAHELKRMASSATGMGLQPQVRDRTAYISGLAPPGGLTASQIRHEDRPCKGPINEALDVLFQKWRLARRHYKMFSNDGVLGEEEFWRTTFPKIAFILKESNDNFVEIRCKPHGPRGNHHYFWRNLSIWKYVVTSTLRGEEPTLSRAMLLKEKPLEAVAYVNLKKNAECKRRSQDRDILQYVDQDWPFLDSQIEIINPDILFFCGTFKFVRGRINLERIGERTFRAGHRIAIDFFHPACRKGYETTFACLIKSLKSGNLLGL
jgi:hypothetical protein